MPDLGKAVFRIVTDAKDFYRGLDKMEADANAAALSTNKSFKSVDAQVSKSGKQMSLFADQVDETTGQMSMFDDEVGRASSSTKKLASDVDVLTKRGNVLTRTVSGLRSKFSGLNADLDDSNRHTKGLIDRIGSLNIVFRFLGNTMKLLKWPALIAAAGAAAQAIGALGAAAIGLTGALAPAAGALAPFAQGVLTVVGSLKVFKLGLSGVKAALKDFSKELAKPSEDAKKFAAFITTFAPAIKRLRSAAQKPVLAGLTDGIKSASKNLPVLQRVIGETGKSIGVIERSFGRMLGSKAFGEQLGRVGKESSVVLDSLGRSAMNLARTFFNLLDAARPLTTWLAHTIEGWTESARRTAAVGRETGKLNDFFRHTREVLEVVFSLAGHLTQGLIGVGKAARPMGMDILHAIDNAAGRWEKWVNSMRGQHSLTRIFENFQPAVMEMGRLVSDIGDALGRLAKQPGLKDMVSQIRGMVTPLEGLISSTTKALGPALLETLKQFIRLFSTFAGSSGPLTIFVQGLGRAAQFMADLLDSVPLLKSALVTLAGVASLYKMLKIAESISGIKKLRTLLATTGAVGAAEGAAGAAAGAGAGAAAKGAAAGGLLSKVKGLAGRAVIIGGALYVVDQVLNTQTSVTKGLGKNIKVNGARDGSFTESFGDQVGNILPWSDPQGDRIRDTKNAIAVYTTEIKKLAAVGNGTGIKKLRDELNSLTKHDSTGTYDVDAIKSFIGQVDKVVPHLLAAQKLAAKGINVNPNKHTTAEINNVRSSFTTLERTSGARLESIRTNLRLYEKSVKTNLGEGTREAKDALAKGFLQAASSVQKRMDDATISTKHGMELIDRYMTQWLAQYGIKGVHATRYLHGGAGGSMGDTTGTGSLSGGNESGVNARGNIYAGGRALRAAGGATFVGKPGQIGRDNVPALLNGRPSIVANGELVGVFNRHQRRELDQRTADYGGLAGFMGTVNRPHYMAKGGTVPRAHATPGMGALTPGVQSRLDRGRSAAQSRLNQLKSQIAPDPSSVPGGTTNIQGVAVANWIARILKMAMADGVNIQVSSGFRSYAEQVYLWNKLGHDPEIVARPGTSNHEGSKYPRGAVDLSSGSWQSLAAWLGKHPNIPLHHYTSPRDPYHFSARGNARGALIPRVSDGPGSAPMGKKWTRLLASAWHFVAGHTGNKDAPMPTVLLHRNKGDWGMEYPWKGQNYIELDPDIPKMLFTDKWGKWGKKSALNTILHEMVHARQHGHLTAKAAEGGAVSWVTRHLPSFADRTLGLDFKTGRDPEEAPAYRGYEKWVNKHKGGNWVNRGQFKNGRGGLHAARHRRRGPVDVSKFDRVYPKKTTPSQPGFKMTARQVRAVFQWAGFSPGRALQMTQIARGESAGYYPGVMNYGGDGGTGLVQMTPIAGHWGAAAKKHLAKLGGIGAMRNPLLNAKMAKWIYDREGFSPWKGTAFLNRNLNLSSVKGVAYKYGADGKVHRGAGSASRSGTKSLGGNGQGVTSMDFGGKSYDPRPPAAQGVSYGGQLQEALLNLKLARGTWAQQKRYKLLSSVPKAIAQPLNATAKMWTGRYKSALAIVERLSPKIKSGTLTKKEHGTLLTAAQSALSSLGNMSSTNDQILQLNQQYRKPTKNASDLASATADLEYAQAIGDKTLERDALLRILQARMRALAAAKSAKKPNAKTIATNERNMNIAAKALTDFDEAQKTDPFAPYDAATAVAELTPELQDDIDAAKEIVKFREGEYSAAQDSKDPVKIAEAARNLKSARDALSQLTDVKDDPDLEAQLSQAQERIRALTAESNTNAAWALTAGGPGDIGEGGRTALSTVTQNIYTLHPGSPELLRAVGDAATAGISYQGFASSPRESLGY